MEGTLTLRKGDCLVTVADDLLKVEQNLFGFTVVPSEAVCNVWKRNEQKSFDFQPIATKGEAEAFAIFRHEWTLQMYRWAESGAFVLEIWRNDTCLASLEWWSRTDGLTAYTEGDPKAFIHFVATKLLKGENEQ
jgi:hypothetical protein